MTAPDDAPSHSHLLAGACWGLAAAVLLAVGLRVGPSLAVAAAGCAVGLLLAFRWPSFEAWRHPAASFVAAAAGLAAFGFTQGAFFLLAPLVAAAVSWPLASGRAHRPPGTPAAREWPWLLMSFVAGASVFFTQAARRHWSFASGARDLGLFYQTHWLISRGLPPRNTVMDLHALGDHMELLDYPLALLLRVHEGPETLLLVQAVALASAVFPLAWLATRLTGDARLGRATAWVWLLSPDLHAGAMFDYNTTQLGATGLAWTAWALVCRGPGASLAAALVTCLAKENFCLYVALLALALAWRHAPRRRALAAASLAIALFVLELAVLFPRFREGGFRHWDFPALGAGPREAAATVVTRPGHVLGTLVETAEKRRALLRPLLATGYLPVAEPVSLLPLSVNWAERFLSAHENRHWGYHYGAPAAALAALGLVLGAARLARAGRAGPGLAGYAVGCALITGALPPWSTTAGNPRSELYVLRSPSAARPQDVTTNRRAVRFVGRDPDLKVAAQYSLLPHVAGRRFVVELDRAEEADVVVLQVGGNTHPMGRPGWRRFVRGLEASGAFHVAFCEGNSIVLRRGRDQPPPCPAWEAALADARSTGERR